MARESRFQRKVKEEIEMLLPDCIIFKTNPKQIQGIPDLLILYEDRWAALECKKSETEKKYMKNQEYYISKFDKMSFSRMICPENKETVLNELQTALRTRR